MNATQSFNKHYTHKKGKLSDVLIHRKHTSSKKNILFLVIGNPLCRTHVEFQLLIFWDKRPLDAKILHYIHRKREEMS